MSEQDRILLRAVAGAILDGSRGGLAIQLKRPLIPPPPPPLLQVSPRKPWRAKFPSPSAATPPEKPGNGLAFFNGLGGFTPDGREDHVTGRPPDPLSNSVANAWFQFGATTSTLSYIRSELCTQ